MDELRRLAFFGFKPIIAVLTCHMIVTELIKGKKSTQHGQTLL
jgi:hypothetical protein